MFGFFKLLLKTIFFIALIIAIIVLAYKYVPGVESLIKDWLGIPAFLG